MLRKTLWVAFDAIPSDVIQQALYIGAYAVAIRTSNPLDAAAIQAYHAAPLKVFGWYFPAVAANPTTGRNADAEAKYVKQTLIPNGLDGYFFDPEGTSNTEKNWDQPGLGPMASSFCSTILGAVPQGRPFLFGLTSHYLAKGPYPNLPWGSIVPSCDVLVPQAYWRAIDEHGHINPIGNGPAANYTAGASAWAQLHGRGTIIPMAGELRRVTNVELDIYMATAAGRPSNVALYDATVTDLYFYADDLTNPQANLDVIRNPGTAQPW